MKLCKGAVLALAVSYGLIYCHTNKSKFMLEQKGDSLTLIHITNPTNYILLPIEEAAEESRVRLDIGDAADTDMDIRLAQTKVDYWVPFVLPADAKTVTVRVQKSLGDALCWKEMKLSDTFDPSHTDKFRPVYHHAPLYGWMNNANGLVYEDEEYHLYYQYNPYGSKWGNMHWGHAVSNDLIHWEELPIALYPDEHGTVFSGSAVIDYDNTSGFGKNGIPAMVAIYTADNPEKQVQCIAYSLDKGRTWTKYKGNPVIDSKAKWNSKDTRDPKVFWHKPSGKWVMVLNERDGHSIYNSDSLKDWTFESHITGFWECPELFELPVDGNKDNTKWVMYGASGTYMLGVFDGKKFTPESGKYYYSTGSIYAAQTFTNIPESDGRRIQIGWGRISHPGMPFNGMMLFPTELSLRTTKDGIRLFSKPIDELDRLQTSVGKWRALTADKADELLRQYKDASTLRIRTTLKLSHATNAGLNLFGQSLLDYDMNYNRINGVFYSPEDMTSMEIAADIILDKTSIEVYIDDGAYSYSMERRPDLKNREGFHFFGNNIEVKEMEVYTFRSIWE